MKKICFSEEFGLQQSVLDRKKTQTRRVITRPMLDRIIKFQHEYFDATFELLNGAEPFNQYFFVEERETPPFVTGEIVAIAQRYADIGIDPKSIIKMPIKGSKTKGVMQCEASYSAGWTNKMFVRPDFMPHHIRILNVRIENLQDITDAGCIAEGIREMENGYFVIANMPDSPTFFNSRFAYAWLIDKISGKGTWDNNPFVFVYDFELVK